jgi:hypothetical protein
MEQVFDVPKRIRTVFVADSHAIVREGIRDRLERFGNLAVVAEASDGYSGEMQFPIPDCGLIWFRVSALLIRDHEGKPRGSHQSTGCRGNILPSAAQD